MNLLLCSVEEREKRQRFQTAKIDVSDFRFPGKYDPKKKVVRIIVAKDIFFGIELEDTEIDVLKDVLLGKLTEFEGKRTMS